MVTGAVRAFTKCAFGESLVRAQGRDQRALFGLAASADSCRSRFGRRRREEGCPRQHQYGTQAGPNRQQAIPPERGSMAYQKLTRLHPVSVPYLRNVMLLHDAFLDTGCGRLKPQVKNTISPKCISALPKVPPFYGN